MRSLLLLLLLSLACTADPLVRHQDLGTITLMGSTEGPEILELEFEVEPGEDQGPIYTFVTCGSLAVHTVQDRERSWERLQLVASRIDYTRRSWRGRSPYIDIPAEETDGCQEYELRFINHGENTAYGHVEVELVEPEGASVRIVHNTPDCTDCDDRAGELRQELLGAIQGARETLDVAIYGIDDEEVVDAICEAAGSGIRVRVISDDVSEEEGGEYHDALYGYEGIASCGAQVEAVRASGLMHHKFLIVDAHGERPLVVTGSTNFTRAGFEENHNHMVFLRGNAELALQYEAEMDQLVRHCASERLDDRTCGECTPSCVEDHSEEGPFLFESAAGEEDVTALAYFSLSDDPLQVLRGDVRTEMFEAPDAACSAEDADCTCRASGSRFKCSYCGLVDGDAPSPQYGLIGEAHERVMVSMYAATDECFGVALRHAQRRGVEVVTVWDYVNAGSPYSRDEYICESGIPTYIAEWGHRAQVRNHNKLVVADDVVFTGSLNLSGNATTRNNENTLVLRSAALADQMSAYVHSEVELLAERGVTQHCSE
ncbi:MAG: phosphatidylserine/phosphatidylglycerophosphate/cardiolipin synthase-like enzyme [Polyangiales bacterium]|jgi:phosphatidylserine/phosphatidylglycerophosphate/cardiolipin synthase-like enzyme